jgi:hypothetical protein
MKLTSVCIALVLATLTANCLAQQPAAGYEHLTFLEPLIGSWEWEWTAPQDYPALGIKEGDKGSLTITYEWCSRRNGILVRERGEREDGSDKREYGVTLIGWDHVQEKVVAHRLGDITGWSKPVYGKTDDGLSLQLTRVSPEGVKTTRHISITIDGNKMVMTTTRRVRDGEVLDPDPPREFTKKK